MYKDAQQNKRIKCAETALRVISNISPEDYTYETPSGRVMSDFQGMYFDMKKIAQDALNENELTRRDQS